MSQKMTFLLRAAIKVWQSIESMFFVAIEPQYRNTAVYGTINLSDSLSSAVNSKQLQRFGIDRK